MIQSVPLMLDLRIDVVQQSQQCDATCVTLGMHQNVSPVANVDEYPSLHYATHRYLMLTSHQSEGENDAVASTIERGQNMKLWLHR